MLERTDGASVIAAMDGLVSFWDFQIAKAGAFEALGPYSYRLTPMRGEAAYAEDGIFGSRSLQLGGGQWLSIPRRECPDLNFSGREAQVTVAAWLKRDNRESAGCEFIAGMWNETERKRQYGLFLNLGIWDSAEQVCGHVSAVGGPTPGYRYSMSSSIGSTPVSKGEWHLTAFTYDGRESRAYLDGELDRRDIYNPYVYPDGLFDGGPAGADFTVGAVNRSGEIGNYYKGLMGGLAVFSRALSEQEIRKLHELSRRDEWHNRENQLFVD